MKTIRYWTTHTDKSPESWREILQLDRLKFNLIPDSVSPDYLIVSEHLYVSSSMRRWFKKMNNGRRVTLFFSGEAVVPDMNIYDYAVSFDRNLVLDDRIGRMPTVDFFRTHLFCSDFFVPRQNVAEELRAKTRFCNFVYSNPKAHPMRDRLFHKLSEYKHVDSQGAHLNNVGTVGSRNQSDWRGKAVLMKRLHKFSIACENAAYNGYTTEKILSSFQAMTVPIYWGDPSIATEFNSKAFINVGDYENLDEVQQIVQEIDCDDDRWIQMVAEPIMTGDQILCYQKRHRRYVDFIEHIFAQEMDAAKRVPVGFWPSKYLFWFDEAIVPHFSFRALVEKLRGRLA